MSNGLVDFLFVEGTCVGMMLLFRVMALTLSRTPEARADGLRLAVRMGAYGNGGAAVGAAYGHAWLSMTAFIVIGGLVLLWIWWRRKKRRNAAALLGAKSRALRDALVRRVKESGKARPALRPVPVPS